MTEVLLLKHQLHVRRQLRGADRNRSPETRNSECRISENLARPFAPQRITVGERDRAVRDADQMKNGGAFLCVSSPGFEIEDVVRRIEALEHIFCGLLFQHLEIAGRPGEGRGRSAIERDRERHLSRACGAEIAAQLVFVPEPRPEKTRRVQKRKPRLRNFHLDALVELLLHLSGPGDRVRVGRVAYARDLAGHIVGHDVARYAVLGEGRRHGEGCDDQPVGVDCIPHCRA